MHLLIGPHEALWERALLVSNFNRTEVKRRLEKTHWRPGHAAWVAERGWSAGCRLRSPWPSCPGWHLPLGQPPFQVRRPPRQPMRWWQRPAGEPAQEASPTHPRPAASLVKAPAVWGQGSAAALRRGRGEDRGWALVWPPELSQGACPHLAGSALRQARLTCSYLEGWNSLLPAGVHVPPSPGAGLGLTSCSVAMAAWQA